MNDRVTRMTRPIHQLFNRSARAAKRQIARALWAIGAYGALRRLHLRRTLTVVMFHRVVLPGSDAYLRADREFVVEPREFEACLLFFKRFYNVVSLARVREASTGGPALPDHALLITFDDGWMDNVEHAQPLLAKHGLRATVFVNVDAVRQTYDRWWQDALVELVRHRPEVLEEICEDCGLYTTGRALLDLPLEQRLPRVARWLAYHPKGRQMLDLDKLSTLDRSVWDVGSHGMTHVPFTHAADLEFEIFESAKQLSVWLGQPVDTLAFPHGRYTPEIADQVRQAPYRLVFSSDSRLNPTDREMSSTIGRINIASRDCATPADLGLLLWRQPVS